MYQNLKEYIEKLLDVLIYLSFAKCPLNIQDYQGLLAGQYTGEGKCFHKSHNQPKTIYLNNLCYQIDHVYKIKVGEKEQSLSDWKT